MSNELLCPFHGPYDASLGACPYCSGTVSRPMAPSPLADDDLPTDLGEGQFPGGGGAQRGAVGDDMPTDLGARHHGAKGILDLEDDEVTDLGRRYQEDDVTELDSEETGMLAILWVKEGYRRGRIHKLKDGSVVGRKEGDVILDDPKVSNPHARFVVEDGQFVIWDFGSKNGTFVNGDRIRAATPLNENDLIKIGGSVFVLKVLE